MVRLDGLGDGILSTPFLRALRESCPQARITGIFRPLTAEWYRSCPWFDRVVAAQFPLVRADAEQQGNLRYAWNRYRNRQKVRAKWKAWHLDQRYDLAINLRLDADTQGGDLVLAACRAHWKIGFDEATTAGRKRFNRGSNRWLNQKVILPRWKHEVENTQFLLEALGLRAGSPNLEAWTTPDEETWAQAWLLQQPLRSGSWIGLGLGATQAKRCWPYYEELINRLRAQGWPTVLLGGVEDKMKAETLAQKTGAISVAGQITLGQTTALLRRSRFFIGNDSGTMHLAAAAGIPVVEISSYPLSAPAFGSNCPQRFGPWGVLARILQPTKPVAPCVDSCRSDQAHCIAQIQVEEVLAATENWRTPVGDYS